MTKSTELKVKVVFDTTENGGNVQRLAPNPKL